MRHTLYLTAAFALVSALFTTQVSTTLGRDLSCLGISQIHPVSVSSGGAWGNDRSGWPAISNDGRFITFESLADNLIANDTNASRDVFQYDRQNAQTSRISVSSAGVEANAHSFSHQLSPDGRFITFESWASNLFPGASGTIWNTFIHDQQTGQTVRISKGMNGVQADHQSTSPVPSQDGRYIVFDSLASNLVPDDTNGYSDIFFYDRVSDQTILLSRGEGNAPGNNASLHPTMTSDGRFVAFLSLADNLVSGDDNELADIFVYDVQTEQMRRVPMASAIASIDRSLAHVSLSEDGRYLAFDSEAGDLVPGDTNVARDIFIYDLQSGVLARVSLGDNGVQANADSTRPKLSADGRYVVFQSLAANLVAGDTNNTWDVFIRDLTTDKMIRLSLTEGCAGANGASYFPDISGDGKYAVFASEASNLVAGDSHLCGGVNCADIFLVEVNFNPMAVSPPSIAPQPNFFVGDVTLTWNRVSWAAQYHVQVSPDRNFAGAPVVDQMMDGSALELVLSDLPPATYYWRVQAQRPDGTWSAWSRAEVFVVGL